MDFFGADTPFPDSKDGVKLGESTLNRFLLSNETILVSKFCLFSSKDQDFIAPVRLVCIELRRVMIESTTWIQEFQISFTTHAGHDQGSLIPLSS